VTTLDNQAGIVTGARREYEAPTVTDLGSVAAVTATVAKNKNKDGGANNIKT